MITQSSITQEDLERGATTTTEGQQQSLSCTHEGPILRGSPQTTNVLCSALLTGPLRVKGVPTPPPRSLSLLPLSAPCQWFKGLQTVTKSCRSDKHPAPAALTNLSSTLCAVQRTGPHDKYPVHLSFQNISHPCPSWGGISANATRLMTQPERAHPRHYRQWEHRNKYTHAHLPFIS